MGTTEPDERVVQGITQLERRVARPSYALLLVTGIILLVDGDWSPDSLWVLVSLGLFAALGAVTFGPRWARPAAVGVIAVIAFLMITKPS